MTKTREHPSCVFREQTSKKEHPRGVDRYVVAEVIADKMPAGRRRLAYSGCPQYTVCHVYQLALYLRPDEVKVGGRCTDYTREDLTQDGNQVRHEIVFGQGFEVAGLEQAVSKSAFSRWRLSIKGKQ